MNALVNSSIANMYDSVGDFSHEGLAEVCHDGKGFHVHPDGTPAYMERYDNVGPFNEGLAWAIRDGQGFHIRPDGSPAYEERYDNVGNFHEGLAWAIRDGHEFYIRKDGTRL